MTEPATNTAKTHHDKFFGAVFSILGYTEEKEWVALALEMDLRGYGKTFDEALTDLEDLVVMQVRFALAKSQPELIWKPAEPPYFELYEAKKKEQILAAMQDRTTASPEFYAGGMQIPPAHVIAGLPGGFSSADA